MSGSTYIDQFSAFPLLDGVHVELVGAPHALVNRGVQAFLHLLLRKKKERLEVRGMSIDWQQI